jgi:hypothetical protein
MEFNLGKFEELLARKDKKYPYSRPLTSAQHSHARHHSNLEPSS